MLSRFLVILELRFPHRLHRLVEQLLGVHLGELVDLVLGQELAEIARLKGEFYAPYLIVTQLCSLQT